MSMNLLIVDDEYEILTWLEEMFRYDFDPEVSVYTAASAFDALEWLNRVSFDVVLTDIKMPGMDGLALFQQIKENWPRCKTVFLTGYPNFEDMYRIIRHKDVRYILKSEDDEVIMRTVREVLEEQRKELEQEVIRQKQSQNMEKVQGWIRRDLIGSLLKGEADISDESELAQQARDAGITVELDRPLLMFTLRIDPAPQQKAQSAGSGALLEMAGQSIRTSLPQGLRRHLCVVGGKWGVGIVQFEMVEKQDIKRLYSVASGALEYAQRFFERLSGRSFSVIMESTPITCRDMPAMFLRMKQILGGSLGWEKAVIAHAETVTPHADPELPGKAMARMPLLKTHLEMHRPQEYYAILDEVGAELLQCRDLQDFRGLGLYYSTSMLLLRFIHENQLDERLSGSVNLFRLTRAEEFVSWYEAVQFLYDTSEKIFEALDTHDSDLSDRALKRICDYIDQNLDRDLSLTQLADIGGFNASYLSRLFRHKYNVTITDYVTQKRMKLAARLLETTNDKVQDIAEQTGYLSSQSFARAFRSYYAVSAAEYREISRKTKQANM